jgi:hypothetical protein
VISQTLTRTEAPPQIAAPIILPLFMPSGKPYWYIPTERLTQVSAQPSAGSSAIAQEAYYSSALDGAVESSNHTQQALLFAQQSPHVPIDAAFVAIETITGCHYELDDFQLQAVTEGREAMGQTVVKLRSGGKVYSGKGISTDIVAAGIHAYLSALNKIVYEEEEV